ncbi:MAG: BspA family leucine-rich repeat surface protein [Clostridia bacterium]|nr:BspA family leucine-rich repeat surface protein [Clostridia bacterium]
MKDSKEKAAKSNSWIFLLLICLATCFMGIGFARIDILLDITGNVAAEAQDGLFITEVNYVSNTGADLNNSKILNTYQTMLNTDITLSATDPNSKITYEVKIYNSTDKDYEFDEVYYMLGENTYDNEDITFSLNGLSKSDIIKSKGTITFNITFYYKNNTLSADNQLISMLNFNFEEFVMLVSAGTLNTSSISGLFGGTIQKSNVERVYFVNHENVPTGATKWDASVEGNYAITGWAVDDNQNGIYEIYLGANNGRITLPANCSSLFYYYTNLLSVDFDNADSSQVTNMSYMFGYSFALTELDLSSFDTSNVTTMAYMFNSVSKIASFDLSNFDTSKTTSMNRMFSGCSPQIVRLDKATFSHLPSSNKNIIPNVSSALTVVVKDTTEKNWLMDNTYYGSNTQILTVEEYESQYPN